MYQVSRLKNGLRVATVNMPHRASVSLGIWVGVGGRYESAEISGISHFIEHMLFKGTKRRSAKEISQAVEGVGGYLNAFTTEEITCFYAKACHDHLPELWNVLSDMFLNSTFDKGELSKERNVIKEELAMYLDQPQSYVQELLNETMWAGQPLGRSITGTEKTLDTMNSAGLIAYQRNNYASEGSLVVAAGKVDHAELVRLVERSASRFSTAPRPVFAPATVDQKVPRVKLFTKVTEQTQIALGIRTSSRHDESRFALRLLNTMLGENMSSRLFQTVREDHGLAYSIYSAQSAFDDVGTLTISAGLETEKLEKALRLIMLGLQGFVEKPVTSTELRRARDYVIGQMEMSLENTESQMMWAGENLLAYGRTIEPAEVKARLAEVRPSAIQALARLYFRPEQMSLALVSPRLSDRGLLKLLKI